MIKLFFIRRLTKFCHEIWNSNKMFRYQRTSLNLFQFLNFPKLNIYIYIHLSFTMIVVFPICPRPQPLFQWWFDATYMVSIFLFLATHSNFI